MDGRVVGSRGVTSSPVAGISPRWVFVAFGFVVVGTTASWWRPLHIWPSVLQAAGLCCLVISVVPSSLSSSTRSGGLRWAFPILGGRMNRRLTGLEKALRLFLAACTAAALVALAWMVRAIFFPPDPSVPNAQLRSFASNLKQGQTRPQVEALASRYDQLDAYGARRERLIVETPRRFAADNWLAHIYFGRDGKIRSVSFGDLDAAPLRPRYPAPPGMPEDQCFVSPSDCEEK